MAHARRLEKATDIGAPYTHAALSPIPARVTVAETVYVHLREALILGRFDPGQPLTIGSLASTFQTSHMPVREALQRLAAEGAVVVQPNGSACVPEVTREALHDISRARVALECLAAELAAEQATAAELQLIEVAEAAHKHSAATGQMASMLEANRSFHFAVYAAARSPVLLHLIESLWLRYGPFMRYLSIEMEPRIEQGTHDSFLQGHRHIVLALRAGNVKAAREGIQRDIEGTRDLLALLLGESQAASSALTKPKPSP